MGIGEGVLFSLQLCMTGTRRKEFVFRALVRGSPLSQAGFTTWTIATLQCTFTIFKMQLPISLGLFFFLLTHFGHFVAMLVCSFSPLLEHTSPFGRRSYAGDCRESVLNCTYDLPCESHIASPNHKLIMLKKDYSYVLSNLESWLQFKAGWEVP